MEPFSSVTRLIHAAYSDFREADHVFERARDELHTKRGKWLALRELVEKSSNSEAKTFAEKLESLPF